MSLSSCERTSKDQTSIETHKVTPESLLDGQNEETFVQKQYRLIIQRSGLVNKSGI